MKTKFKGVDQVRKNLLSIDSWLANKTAKKDTKCQNCGKEYVYMSGGIALLRVPGQLNKHVCSECADHYINLGAADIEATIKKRQTKKQNLINEIKELGNWVPPFYGEKNLEKYDIEDLEKIRNKCKELKEKTDRIDSIVISDEDAYMEDYLKKEYNVIQDVKYLKCEDQIKSYFTEDYGDYFDCGQGYFQDEATVIAKIGKKFYEVTIHAEIGSQKQDYGDKLYWVESIERVTWKEIEKPEPKKYHTYNYQIHLNEDQKNEIDKFLSKYSPDVSMLV